MGDPVDLLAQIEELRAQLAAARAESERLRSELAATRRRDHETPPHYL